MGQATDRPTARRWPSSDARSTPRLASTGRRDSYLAGLGCAMPRDGQAGRCDCLHEVVDAETEELVAPPPEMRSERGPTSSRRQLGGGGGG